MTFYRSNQQMEAKLEELINQFAKQGRPGLHNSLSISWIRYNKMSPEPHSGEGAGWSDEKLIYPASVVKLIYGIATEAWIQKGLLPESQEIRDAVGDMIIHSSNDATSLVIDFLTGTTSGPILPKARWERWKRQRELINKWLSGFQWEELKGVNCCQKTWTDGPYGREKQFYGSGRANQNLLSTRATARMLEAVMTNAIISPISCRKLRNLLSRSLDIGGRRNDPENQIDGFLGEGLVQGSRLWSKAGWMSTVRHDAAWISSPQSNPILLIVFSQGRQLANDTFLLPALANELCKASKEIDSQ